MIPAKKVIGLTGGIASGKSTVGRIFQGLGVTVIDADQLAREVVAPGTEGYREVILHFGADFVRADGILDRQKLGALVFSRPELLAKLNELLHPRIAQLSSERILAAKDGPTPYVIYDAALHVESGAYKRMAKLVVVAASVELQVERLIRRNGLTESEARDRLAAQCPLSKKLAVADYVIQNDNDRDALEKRVRRVHEELLGL